MAIIQYAGNRFTGLVADTKPENIPDGALFTELDGDKITYIREGGQWVEYIGETIEAVNSIEIDDGELQLVGDEESPGNNKVYGTDGSGVKGWKDDPAGGGGSERVVFGTPITSTSADLTANDHAQKYTDVNNVNPITLTIKQSSFTAGDVVTLEQVGLGQFSIQVENASNQTITVDAVKSWGQGSILQITCKSDTSGNEIFTIVGGIE